MWTFLDGTPDMYQSKQTKDCGGGHEICLHELRRAIVAVHFIWFRVEFDRWARQPAQDPQNDDGGYQPKHENNRDDGDYFDQR